jgi:hypothetical protein
MLVMSALHYDTGRIYLCATDMQKQRAKVYFVHHQTRFKEDEEDLRAVCDILGV